MLTHPHLLGSDADELDETRARRADDREQKQREPRQRIIASRENPDVRPGIEIVLNGEEENLLFFAPIPKLGAIGVSFPADAAQQFPIGGMESNEITTAAVVRAEDEVLRLQLSESALDVGRAQSRAIPADCDHFFVA